MRTLATLVVVSLLAARGSAADKEALARDERLLRGAGVATDGPGLLAFFRQHTTNDADTASIERLIKDLGSDHFPARERASARLSAIGSRAVPLLRQAVNDRDLEVAERVRRCLSQIQLGSVETLLESAARLIAVRKPDGAARVLLDYLPVVTQESVAEEMQNTLMALALREGKPDPVLVAALSDRAPERRSAAAVALARAGAAKAEPGVRKLLRDPKPQVRLRVGLALAAAREKEALPVLIALLDELPPEAIAPIEELLFTLADDKAPSVGPGTTAAARREYRSAWENWYRVHKDGLDAARLEAALRPRNHTLLVLLDAGRIVDLDAANKTRWQFDGVKFPLDAQPLPGDRVLLAEYHGNRVSERNRKGEVLWEKKILAPLVAQRLPNGNTFIATASRFVEVDRKGQEVWDRPPPQSGRIMKAVRLGNGDVACVTSLGGARFFLIDRAGNIRRSFAVELSTSGGRLDVQRNGHVLIPEKENNRIIEYSAEGRPVWTASFAEPIAAVRLGNGNTLVTAYNKPQAVELDRQGKPVRAYKADARVTRAWRH